MLFVKSFCGKECGYDAHEKAVESASGKADAWVTGKEEEWEHVEVTALASQYFTAGDYAMYVITMTVNVEGCMER